MATLSTGARNALWALAGGPGVAIALSAAAWVSIAIAFATSDARFTAAFLVLAVTAPCVALFSLLAERRVAAGLALLITLAAPLATWIYIDSRPSGWLS